MTKKTDKIIEELNDIIKNIKDNKANDNSNDAMPKIIKKADKILNKFRSETLENEESFIEYVTTFFLALELVKHRLMRSAKAMDKDCGTMLYKTLEEAKKVDFGSKNKQATINIYE